MITPSFSLTATERVLPKLALDFTTGSLDGRVTFTRTTDATHPATYINSSGVVTAATNNQPRFDYDPVTLACKGLLIEESRTNILTYSEDFANAAWVPTVVGTASAPVVTANQAIAPDGTMTADKVVFNSVGTASTDRSLLVHAVTVTASTAYSGGLWARTESGTASIVIRHVAVGGFTTINLTEEWQRFNVTETSGTTSVSFSIGTKGNQGAVSATVYLWGAQLEAGAFATSYIPTTTTALTRNADVATMTGTNFSDWFTQGDGSFTAKYIRYAGSGAGLSRNILSVSDGTNNNRIELNMANSLNDGCYIVTGGVAQAQIVGGLALFDEVALMSVGFQENNTSVSVNGANPVTDSSVLIPTVDRMNIGRNGGGGGGFYNGWIRKIYFYPQRLVNAELQAFSK